MVDLEVLKKFKVSADDWKTKLQGKRGSRGEKVEALIERMRCKIQAGRDLNLERYQVHKAMDDAWDAGLKQITPTLLSTLQDKQWTSREECLDALKGWGLDPSEIIREVPDPKTQGKNTFAIDTPAFFRIMVPLVQAYIKMRWAKITNDRRMVPLFKYDPVVSDNISRLKCDVLTARVEAMSRQYGYFDIMKQAIFRTLHYGECIQFVVEEWDTQCTLIEDKVDLPGEVVSAPDGTRVKKIIIKEGLRYHIPHPTRTYRDQAFWPSTINTDSGCKFMGYWRVLRYSDIADTPGYYNLDAIGVDDFAQWFAGKQSHSYWKNVMSGCALNFPDATTTEGAGGQFDSEKHVAAWYSQDMADKPIVISEHFEKIIPSQCGLGDYDYPVWARFVIAADDQVIYAAPLPYVPGIWYGYDYVEGRTHNASMTLEVLPFQDQFTNLLTQLLLTTRQNLANMTLVDSDIIDKKDIDKINNWGEKFYRSINVIAASFKRLIQKQQTTGQVAIPVKFPVMDTNSIIQSMKVVLDTLERVLVMSAQEVGQSASHEQTREEVRYVAQNTSTRVTFTSQAIDTGRDVMKRQLYNGLMAYGQPQMWAQVPMDQPMSEEDLTALGFTVAGPYDHKNRRQYLKVENKTALAFESFASDRDGQDRVNDAQTAQAMVAMLDKVLNNQNLFPAVGADQCIRILNEICRLLDFPRDFKIVNTGQTQAMMDEIKSALQEVAQQSQQQIGELSEDIRGAVKEITLKNKEQDVTMHDIATKVNLILGESNKIEVPMGSAGDLDANFQSMAG